MKRWNMIIHLNRSLFFFIKKGWQEWQNDCYWIICLLQLDLHFTFNQWQWRCVTPVRMCSSPCEADHHYIITFRIFIDSLSCRYCEYLSGRNKSMNLKAIRLTCLHGVKLNSRNKLLTSHSKLAGMFVCTCVIGQHSDLFAGQPIFLFCFFIWAGSCYFYLFGIFAFIC